MAAIDIDAMVAELELLLEEKMSLRQGTLGQKLQKAGRRLPKSVRHDGEVIDLAHGHLAHPKLVHQIDVAAVRDAHIRVRGHLISLDARNRRKGFILGVLGGLSFNLILMAVLVGVVLHWRGYI